MPLTSLHLRRAWSGILGLFVLAGLTGAFFRFGVRYGQTFGLELTNVIHAHSHLMYFGWVTPALLALVALRLPSRTGRPPGEAWPRLVGVLLGLSLLVYPLFLAFGYRPAAIGTARLPLAVIVSSLHMIAWYAAAFLYVRATRGLRRDAALLSWDLAVTFLVLSTLGAWALAALTPLGLQDPAWASALTHIFLDLFAEGWFVFGLLGLAFAAAERPARTWGLALMALGLPVTFALGMSPPLVPEGLHLLARAGGTLVGVGLLANVALLWRDPGLRRWTWRVPLALLALKALAGLGVCLLPGFGWADVPGLRILYLHVLLLGGVTLGLTAAARETWGAGAVRGQAALFAVVLLVLAGLLAFTPYWPDGARGAWTLTYAAWAALGPPAVAAVMSAANLVLAGKAGTGGSDG